MKNELIKLLKELQNNLLELKQILSKEKGNKEKGKNIYKKDILKYVESTSCKWFDKIEPNLMGFDLPEEVLKKYKSLFKYLLKLGTAKASRKSSLDITINDIYKNFRNDLIISIQTSKESTLITGLDEILLQIKDQEENEYIEEAINCAKNDYLRAAVVLGWCAAIDRIHNRIEQLGFNKFNKTSLRMASQTSGRFKKFNQKQNVNSISELRMVFDNIILWILEGMNLIDANQHIRLKSCFDMRTHAAHPGKAPITKYNVMSFFSDLNEIVLNNPTFNLENNNN